MKSTSSLPATHEIQTQPTIKSSVQIAIENFTKQYLQKHSDTFENELDRSVRYLYHDHRPLKKLESVVATIEQWEIDLPLAATPQVRIQHLHREHGLLPIKPKRIIGIIELKMARKS